MENADARPRILWLNAAFLVFTPILALILTPIYIWHHGVQLAEIVALVVLWFIVGQGITTGYHRLFSHKGYKAAWPLRLYLAIVGAAAWQNSIIAWSSDHRTHHKSVDTDDDPYNAKRGFWYSHIGWILLDGRTDSEYKNVPDLWKDPICAWQHRYYWAISTVFNVAVPVALGLWTGRVGGMLIFALLVRLVLVHHFTFTINSLAHMWGSQPWSKGNTARDNWFLSILSFGEGYHNYHHAYQYDYRNGPFWYNYDPSKWFIWSLSYTPMVSNLRRVPDDVLIRRRYEHTRERFLDRLARRGEAAMEEWSQVIRDKKDILSQRSEAVQKAVMEKKAVIAHQAEGLRSRMRQRVVNAEEGLEGALQELQDRRQAWALQRREAKDTPKQALSSRARQELQDMQRAVRTARWKARRALREWNQALAAYQCAPMIAA